MRTRRRATARQLATLAGTVALALAGTACGDDSDSGGADGPQVGGQEGEVRATIASLYEAMGDGDAQGVCDRLTEAAQRQIAGGSGSKARCVKGFQRFLDNAEKAGGLDLTLKAKVEKVKVKGDSATATVSFGEQTRGDIPLVKQDGEWKLEAAGAQP
jgi:hypothetical protein